MSAIALAAADAVSTTAPAAFRAPLIYSGPYPELFAEFPEDQQQELLEIYELIKRLRVPLSVVVGHLKGGVSKTTTIMFLAFLLALFGEEVLVIDADPTNRQCAKWAQNAPGAPRHIDVKTWAGEAGNGHHIGAREMIQLVRKYRKPGQHLLIDTSPAFREYLMAGLQLCDTFIVTSSPKRADITEIGKTIELAANVEAGKDSDIMVLVLLALAKRRTKQLSDAIDLIRRLGVSTFTRVDTDDYQNDDVYVVGDSVDYSGTYCQVPVDFRDYIDVFRELFKRQLDDQEDNEPAEVMAS